MDLQTRIAQARGDVPAEIVLRGGRVLDIVTGDLLEGDVAIAGDTIVGTCATYAADRVIDVTGLTLVPGFIDTHLHIESSLVTPLEFDRCVTPRGVTTAICDPHEIANVIGVAGVRYFQQASAHTLMDIRVQIPSCVPSTHMETSGATLSATDIAGLMGNASGIGLAEFMNYPGVVHRDPDAMAKLALFEGGHIDGHCPLLTGTDLNAYIAAGIRTEHEATSAAEAREKLQKGMRVLIREGSVSKDLHALAPLLTERTAPYICLCTDDRNPLDIEEHGHLDYMLRTLIALGCPPLAAYRAATLSAAEAFGLKDRGQIAPGRRADIVALGSLEACDAQLVLAAGRVVDAEAFAARTDIAVVGRDSVRARAVTAQAFRMSLAQDSPKGGDTVGAEAQQPPRDAGQQHGTPPRNTPGRVVADVIGIRPGQILTDHLREEMAVVGDDIPPDPARDLMRIAVVERHGKNGNIATGVVRGFGMKAGAIASTVCHDHHNIACVGADYDDMALAANRLSQIEGGFVVARDGAVLAELALPVAGLMSLAPFEEVHARLVELRRAARSLGIDLEEPFLQLAFLALPVIPALKITDRGMVDVEKFELIG